MKLNLIDDRRTFERDRDGWTLRIGYWSLSYRRSGNHQIQVTLTDRRPLERNPHDRTD